MTNIPDYNPTSDAIQLRPFELLLQVHNERFPCQTLLTAGMSRKPQTWFRSRVLPWRLYPTAVHPDHPNIPALRRCGRSCGRRASARRRSPLGSARLMSTKFASTTHLWSKAPCLHGITQ